MKTERAKTSALTSAHADHLARFKIPPELLEAAGVHSGDDFAVREFLGISGLYRGEDLSGIIFPYHDPISGNRTGARVRLDTPTSDGAKYLMEPGCRHLFFAPGSADLLKDVTVTAICMEAEKSGFALRALSDRMGKKFLLIAVGGCWGFRRKSGTRPLPDGGTESESGPSPDLDLVTWTGRRVIIAYDSNVWTNDDVKRARRALEKDLAGRGATVLYAEIPLDVNGPDDLIAARGDEAMLSVLTAAKPASGTATTEEAWPAPEPLGEDLPPVPMLDLKMLPDSLRSYVEDISERMQTPLDFAAAAAITSLGGVVGRRALVQPKVHDTEWQVVPNLWGLNIAPPGYLKSPVLHAVTKPLAHVEEMWRNEHAGEVAAYEAEKTKKEIKHRAWRFNAEKAARKDQEFTVEPDTTLVEPIIRRLVLTDSTPEKLQEILAENPAGVFVIRDELIGLIAEMDKEGREQQRGFFLQAWNGYGGYTVDRIGRGTLHVPHVCLSIFGNAQPTRVRSYLANLLAGGPGDDGLFQRFQILVWPDPPTAWRNVDRMPNNTALARAEKVYSILANLPVDSVRMRFAADAQEYFNHWLARHEERIREPKGLHPSFVSHLSKYPSLLPSLAALYELADLAAENTRPEEKVEISAEHTSQAGDTCAYLEQHARRAYSCIVAPQMHAARELAKHIERGVLPETFSLRDIYKRGWASLDTPDGAAGALTVLEDAAWVRKVQAQPSLSGGRPTAKWIVNPAVKRKQE
jgi:hypothetical protein